ncbi:MAG: TolC family protein [Synergistaceae bacterium]|nr:TolC family protein [Synergistaceae bacterium]
MRKIFLTISLFLLMMLPSVLYAEDISGLSLEECLTLALLNHPSLTKAKASTRDIAAQLEALRASTRWKLSLSGSFSYDGDYEDWDSRYHSESLRVTATKLIYDNGRSKLQREIRTESLKGSRETFRNTQITVAANAKKAYYDLVLKMLNRDVEREKVMNLEEHLKRAQGLYEVGNVAFIEVTKAQADVASARVSLLKAENDILVSQEALRVAMGTDIAGPFDILLSTELLLPQPAEDTSALIASALNDRPDYRKLLHDIRGSELAITNAARANSPTVNGTLSSTFSKREGNNSTENYAAGITVTVPIVDGGEVKANVASARAQLDSVNADAEALRQQITYSVRSAALSLTNATDRVRSSEASVKYAEENLELAKGRYEVGVGEPLELSDAVSTLASSRYTYYQALYDAQTARAELDAALGHFPPEIDGRIGEWEAE